MSERRAEVVQLWFHLILLLLQAGPTNEAPGDFLESKSTGPLYVEVGLGHGSHRSG